MDIANVAGQDDEQKIFCQLVGQFGGPAFIRRAQSVQLAYDALLETCRRQREEWLGFVRLRLGTLVALAGSRGVLVNVLEGEDGADLVERLHADLQPRLRLPVAPTSRPKVLESVLAELRESLSYFNQRWQRYVQELDLGYVNELRDGYNRFYVMEKECALGSVRVARQGFRKLDMLGADDILKVLPMLPVP